MTLPNFPNQMRYDFFMVVFGFIIIWATITYPALVQSQFRTALWLISIASIFSGLLEMKTSYTRSKEIEELTHQIRVIELTQELSRSKQQSL